MGTPHAEIMTQMGMALEEYFEFLKNYRYGEKSYIAERKQGERYAVSFVRADEMDGAVELEVDELRPYSISGNNCDGFIVTEYCKR